MTIARELLNFERKGVREVKAHVSAKYLNKPFIITDYGQPVSVNMPYEELLEFVDLVDELMDSETIKTVAEGRKSIGSRSKGIPVSRLFKKIKAKKK
ncbi:MAG: hypothetical protein P9L90_07030 [Candidatus Aadella gelida]|nr:hypothetical protein [Candidatus Aadella gelida]